jgi:predicted aspartyl protease
MRAGLALAMPLLLFATGRSAADDSQPQICALAEFVSLDMETMSDGEFAVPVRINNRPVSMVFDTGSKLSSISSELADELGVQRDSTRFGGAFLNNVAITQEANVDQFRIGPLLSDHGWKVLIVPNTAIHNATFGLLAPDFIKDDDIEIDFYHGKFNIFRHNRCDGHVVYWTHDPYAAVPMTLDSNNHINVQAVLDGRAVNVTIDTGSSNSVMSLDAARSLFGWDMNEPRLKSLGSQKINGGQPTPLYKFPFSSLSFEGIAILNPQITLIPQEHFMRTRDHDVNIIIGVSVLRQLRMYIDYRDHMLYLTDAEAK